MYWGLGMRLVYWGRGWGRGWSGVLGSGDEAGLVYWGLGMRLVWCTGVWGLGLSGVLGSGDEAGLPRPQYTRPASSPDPSTPDQPHGCTGVLA